MENFEFLLNIDLFKKSLDEQKDVLKSFWTKAEDILDDSGIGVLPIPESWNHLKHNYFSVLFIAIFQTLEIPTPRLKLYAKLNHCLRSWVTACDNLLDDELKEIIITDLPPNAKIFKSVHATLLTDRIFFSFLMDALKEKTISDREMRLLLNISLNSISVSGLEEAQEEGGIKDYISPEAIIEKIHYAKTGRLFTATLSAPLELGDIDIKDEKVKQIYDGLISLGIGCQILDDISDIDMDINNEKYNYLSSLILASDDETEKHHLESLLSNKNTTGDQINLYQEFPKASSIALNNSIQWLKKAFQGLNNGGINLSMNEVMQFMKNIAELYTRPEDLMFIRDR